MAGRASGTIIRFDPVTHTSRTVASGLDRPGALVIDPSTGGLLVAEADPITTVEQGRAVAARLQQGHLIVQEGGPHVIFGYGNECPDEQVNAFILEGTVPEEGTICPGVLMTDYVPGLSMLAFERGDHLFFASPRFAFETLEIRGPSGRESVPLGIDPGGMVDILPGPAHIYVVSAPNRRDRRGSAEPFGLRIDAYDLEGSSP